MKKNKCLVEGVAKFGVGVILLTICGGFVLIGLTALPVIGFTMAAAVLATACLFMAAPKDKNCERM